MKILRAVLIIALLTVTFQSVWAAKDDGRIPIRIHLAEGESYHMKDISDMTFTVGTGDQRMDMVYNFGVGYTMNVEKVEKNGTSHLRIVYTSVFMKTTGGLLDNMEYDSTDLFAEPSLLTAAIGGFVGEEYTVRMDDQGRVKKAEGIKEMVKSIVDRMQINDEKFKKQMEKILMKSLKESSKMPLNGVEGLYAPKPVQVGDSWKSRSTMESNGIRVELNTTFALKECANGRMTIIIASPYKSTRGTLEDAGSLEISTGIQQGTVILDQNTGWVIDADVTNEFEGIIKVKNVEVPFSATVRNHIEPFV